MRHSEFGPGGVCHPSLKCIVDAAASDVKTDKRTHTPRMAPYILPHLGEMSLSALHTVELITLEYRKMMSTRAFEVKTVSPSRGAQPSSAHDSRMLSCALMRLVLELLSTKPASPTLELAFLLLMHATACRSGKSCIKCAWACFSLVRLFVSSVMCSSRSCFVRYCTSLFVFGSFSKSRVLNIYLLHATLQ